MSVPSSRRVPAAVLVTVVVLGLAGGPIPPASAGDGPQSTPPIRHDVVVTATRVETPVREVASAVTVLTRADFERTGRRTVLEALGDVPGLDLLRNGGPGSASAAFVRGAGSEHVLVLLDGVPLNDPVNPSRSFDLAHLTLDAVDRIEILRGPQSTLYGSDALGGVINILTSRGSGRPRLTLQAFGGSFRTLDTGLDLRGSKGVLNYAFGLSRQSTRGTSAASSAYAGNVEKDGYRNATLAGRIGLALRGGTEVDVVIRSVSARTEIDAFGGPFGDDPNSVQAYGSVFARAQARALFGGGRWESRLGLSYVRARRNLDNPTDPLHPADSETGRYSSSIARLDWQNDLFLNAGQTLTFGIDAERETGSSTYVSESLWGSSASEFPGRSADRAGVFVQDRMSFGGTFFATAGLRLDRHGREGTALTFRLAPAVLLERTGTKLKATLGTAFKAPSLYQLYAPGTFWGPIGNPSLAPEESLGWDAGFEQSLAGGAALFGVSYFRNELRNLVDFDFARGYVNVGRARTSGWEVAAEGRPLSGLALRASYTRLDARDLTRGTPLPRRPKDKLAASVRWAFAGGWEAGLSAVATGPRPDRDYASWPAREVILAGFTLLGAHLSFAPAAGIEIFGRLDNILGARGETVFGYGWTGFAAYGGVRVGL